MCHRDTEGTENRIRVTENTTDYHPRRGPDEGRLEEHEEQTQRTDNRL